MLDASAWAHCNDLDGTATVSHLIADHAQDFSTLHRMDERELRAYHVGLEALGAAEDAAGSTILTAEYALEETPVLAWTCPDCLVTWRDGRPHLRCHGAAGDGHGTRLGLGRPL